MEKINTDTEILNRLKKQIELNLPDTDVSINEYIEYELSENSRINLCCNKFDIVVRSRENHAHRNILFVGFLIDEFEKLKHSKGLLNDISNNFPYTCIIISLKNFDVSFYRAINQNHYENDKGYYDFSSFTKLVKANNNFLWLSNQKQIEILQNEAIQLNKDIENYWSKNKDLTIENVKLKDEIKNLKTEFSRKLTHNDKKIKELSEKIIFFENLNKNDVRNNIKNLFLAVDYLKLIELVDKPEEKKHYETFSHPGQTNSLERISSITNSKIEYWFSILNDKLILRMEIFDWHLSGPCDSPSHVLREIKIFKFSRNLDNYTELNNVDELNHLFYIHIDNINKD